jgi:hypothetical protein
MLRGKEEGGRQVAKTSVGKGVYMEVARPATAETPVGGEDN